MLYRVVKVHELNCVNFIGVFFFLVGKVGAVVLV